MRILGLFLVLLGLACGGWGSASFIMRNTYFRPLADSASAYTLARDAGDQLAKDLFYPTVASSGSLVAIGSLLLFKRKKVANQPPVPMRENGK